MTTIAVRRTDVPFWPTVGLAVVAWLIAWFITLPLANWIPYELLGLQQGSQLGDAIAFFLYDVPKVLLLLTGIVTLVSFLRSSAGVRSLAQIPPLGGTLLGCCIRPAPRDGANLHRRG